MMDSKARSETLKERFVSPDEGRVARHAAANDCNIDFDSTGIKELALDDQVERSKRIKGRET